MGGFGKAGFQYVIVRNGKAGHGRSRAPYPVKIKWSSLNAVRDYEGLAVITSAHVVCPVGGPVTSEGFFFGVEAEPRRYPRPLGNPGWLL